MTDWKNETLLATLEKNPGASEAAIEEMTAALGARLPDDYLALLRFTNGAEGVIGPSGYVQLWRAGELAPYNLASGSQKWAPGLVIIGTNGGNVAYGIDTRRETPQSRRYVETDLIGMGWDSIFFQGASLYDLFHHIAYGE